MKTRRRTQNRTMTVRKAPTKTWTHGRVSEVQVSRLADSRVAGTEALTSCCDEADDEPLFLGPEYDNSSTDEANDFYDAFLWDAGDR